MSRIFIYRSFSVPDWKYSISRRLIRFESKRQDRIQSVSNRKLRKDLAVVFMVFLMECKILER